MTETLTDGTVFTCPSCGEGMLCSPQLRDLTERLAAAERFGLAQEARCRDLDAACEVRAEKAEARCAELVADDNAWRTELAQLRERFAKAVKCGDPDMTYAEYRAMLEEALRGK